MHRPSYPTHPSFGSFGGRLAVLLPTSADLRFLDEPLAIELTTLIVSTLRLKPLLIATAID